MIDDSKLYNLKLWVKFKGEYHLILDILQFGSDLQRYKLGVTEEYVPETYTSEELKYYVNVTEAPPSNSKDTTLGWDQFSVNAATLWVNRFHSSITSNVYPLDAFEVTEEIITTGFTHCFSRYVDGKHIVKFGIFPNYPTAPLMSWLKILPGMLLALGLKVTELNVDFEPKTSGFPIWIIEGQLD